VEQPVTESAQHPDSGVYIAVFYLSNSQRICVGRLGRFYFPNGLYFYVGSAQRGLSARINRHGRRGKPLQWHIDYLSCRAKMLGAIVVAGPRKRECELAGELASMYELLVPNFGSSDCRCGGHLFYSPDFA
jgi:sugar fermentation stimulation protein A